LRLNENILAFITLEIMTNNIPMIITAVRSLSGFSLEIRMTSGTSSRTRVSQQDLVIRTIDAKKPLITSISGLSTLFDPSGYSIVDAKVIKFDKTTDDSETA
jgi:hypothetical protein